MSRTRILALLAVLGVLIGMPRPPATAQSAPPVIYLQYNSDLNLNSNGVLHVRILQQIGFGDQFSSAFFDIPKAFTTRIENVRVLAATTPAGHRDPAHAEFAPIDASVSERMDTVSVEWNYERTDPGDIRSFIIEYDAVGAVWLYPDGDFLSWNAVNADRSGVPVQASTVRLTLPTGVSLDEVSVTERGPAYTVEREGQTFVFTAGEPLPDGMAFEVEAHFPHGRVDTDMQDWQRAWDGEHLDIAVERFHADLTLQPDGIVHVEETTDLRVAAGTLHQGFRTISLLYIDDVTHVRAGQDGQALSQGSGGCRDCFVVNRLERPDTWVYYDPDLGRTVVQEENSGRVSVDWYGAPRQAPTSTTITMAYDLVGALRVTPDSQLLVWPVTPDYGLPIGQATLRIHLPPGVSPDDVTVEGPARQGTPQVEDGDTLTLVYDGPVAPGAWGIALTLPGAATTATPPQWQSQFETVMAEADQAAVARARSLLLQRFLGIVTLGATGLAALIAWVRRGRTSVREKLHGYVSEPPAPLSPAIVSYLVDRKATEQGILGAIFHLATLGALEIDLANGITLRRRRAEPIGSAPTLPDAYGNPVPVDRHLAYLFDSVLLPVTPQDRAVSLDAVAPALRSHLPELYAQLGRDVQQYFIGTPDRGRRVPPILWGILFGVLASLVLFGVLSVLLAAVIGLLVGILLVSFGRSEGAAAYSNQGAQEADRWRRFKNYLADLRQYGDQAAAQEILDRYFGYAVALGVEQVVLAQAESLGAGGPVWMPLPTSAPTSSSAPSSSQQWPARPRPRPRPNLGSILGTPRPRPTAPRPRPTLAGMSERLGGSLRRASSDLGTLLATAAGSSDSSGRSVVLDSRLRRREMQWQPGTPVATVLDDILRQSVSDVREIQARAEAQRIERAQRAASDDRPGGSSSGSHGSSSHSSGSGWRSSGGFGRSSSSSSSSSRSSSSSSRSSGSSRSGGGGRSGFR
ncbi:MAG: DUF2207 domain-containing protein [Caldilineaceae bacterium]|nr:DUF2207 domain-containing protein [Caldilineaceae bacterium]